MVFVGDGYVLEVRNGAQAKSDTPRDVDLSDGDEGAGMLVSVETAELADATCDVRALLASASHDQMLP